MSSKQRMVRLSLCLVVLGLVAAVPVFAGSAPVGSVAGSMNATVGGQELLPNSILFSGDNLQVKDGLAVVALGSASRMVFGRDTVASFLGNSNEITVVLGQGSVSMYHDANGMPVRMKIGDLSVVPVSGFKTLGEVATLNGAVVVTAKEGTLRVEGNGPAIDVTKGKTVTLVQRTKAPQQTGGGGNAPNAGRMGSSWWEPLDAGLAAVGIIIGAVGISRADTASDNASSATIAAGNAASAAAAAASAAAAALSAASTAISEANAAAIAAGCALNLEANSMGLTSPYIPPAGVNCGNSATW